jgi:hypothetical protein
MDIEALRAAVVKKHNVLLGKDDPIFISVHLNELVLAEVLANMKSIATESRNDSIATVAHQVEVAKRAAATLITQTAGYVAAEVQRQVKSALEESTARASESRRLTDRARDWALIAAAASVIAGGAAIGVLVAMFLKR